MNRHCRNKAVRGFTLVELLVALGLGVLLTSGIANIYLQNRQNYVQDEEIARLQENARYAINLLKRDLTMAGFFAGLNDINPTAVTLTTDCVSGVDWATDVSTSVDFIDSAATGSNLDTIRSVTWTSDCIDKDTVVDQSDIVSIKRTSDTATVLNGVLNPDIPGLVEDDEQYYFRAFDNKATLDFVGIGTGGSIAPTHKDGTQLYNYWEYYPRIFFLRDFSKTAGDEIPTLCLAELNGNEMTNNCYVEGIEDMQLEFGIDDDDDSVADFFIATPSAAQLDEAVVIRVYLLIRSVNPVVGYTNSKTYSLGSKAVAAKNDAFIRRVFSTTVQMRNAKLPNA